MTLLMIEKFELGDEQKLNVDNRVRKLKVNLRPTETLN